MDGFLFRDGPRLPGTRLGALGLSASNSRSRTEFSDGERA